MRRIKQPIVGLGMLLITTVLLMIVGPFTTPSEGQGNQQPINVNVVNAPTVRDADNPARQPVHAFLTLSTDYVVPAGKRLVIEWVSGSASIPDVAGDHLVAVLVRTALGGPGAIDQRLPLTPTLVLTRKLYSFAELTRLYADPGTTVSISYSYTGGVSDVIVTGVFSGYLVDVL